MDLSHKDAPGAQTQVLKNPTDAQRTDYKNVDRDRNEWITGAFVDFLPGQEANFLFAMFRPEYDNRVYFAGEAYAQPHGWIDTAIYSGILAANALAYYLKAHSHKQ